MKIFKKLRFLILLFSMAICVPLTFSSCEKDDVIDTEQEEGKEDGEFDEGGKFVEGDIIGSWTPVSEEGWRRDGSGEIITWKSDLTSNSFYSSVIVFEKGGFAYYPKYLVNNDIKDTMEWSITNGILRYTEKRFNETTFHDITLSTKNMLRVITQTENYYKVESFKRVK